MKKQMITIAEGFQTSVNIAYDLYDEAKIRSFIPTTSSIEIIENIMLSTVDSSVQRARLLVGAYGRGKSHIILVLMAMLFQKNETLFATLLDKLKYTNPDTHKFIYEYIRSDKKLLPILISGSNTNILATEK